MKAFKPTLYPQKISCLVYLLSKKEQALLKELSLTSIFFKICILKIFSEAWESIHKIQKTIGSIRSYTSSKDSYLAQRLQQT